MIRKKHIAEELNGAKRVFNDKKATVEEKIHALYRINQIALKVLANVRINTIRIMEKLNIPLIQKEEKTEGEVKNESTDK